MLPKISQVLVVLIVALMTAAIVGCGGGEETAALTKPQFIQRADAICEKADKAQQNGIMKADQKTALDKMDKAEQQELVVRVGLPPVQNEAEEIAALNAPGGDEEQIDAIVSGIEAAVKMAEEDPGSITGASPSPFLAVNKLATRYGLKVCSEAL